MEKGTPFVYLMDDHDMGPNDTKGTSPSIKPAQEAYEAVVPRKIESHSRLWHSFTQSNTLFIVTDGRSYLFTER